MAVKTWHAQKVRFCPHVQTEVALETELIYPADNLPDMPPRVSSHRCSHAMQCNLFRNPACAWAGTNPEYDPFQES